ncbi:hypothetical protein MAPG_10388 [Magnaporthiopsis poae ATCC 64411]|uniref:Uncharacterized protein n=1 Tax=Magnaporthiopsis poae (strain ATCC 64411 / 73-15) TaxID=644358 RepID=A0A0C4ECG4_MAGP6|nr:hypothetical protein MAPG_10388 [Magnaporthiopsis poae ATCC 64411]
MNHHKGKQTLSSAPCFLSGAWLGIEAANEKDSDGRLSHDPVGRMGDWCPGFNGQRRRFIVCTASAGPSLAGIHDDSPSIQAKPAQPERKKVRREHTGRMDGPLALCPSSR